MSTIRQLSSVVIFLLWASFALAAPQGPVIGKITLTLGSVTGTDQDGDTFEVKRGADLHAGYSFETGPRSLVRAEMNDGTKMTISQNSSATLDEFAFEPEKGIGTFNTTVNKGGFKYVSGQLGSLYGSSRKHSSISTPNGVIGVRGTTIEATRDSSGNLILNVPSGRVDVAVTLPNGQTVTQSIGLGTTNQLATVSSTGEISLPADVPEALRSAVEQLVVLIEAAEDEAAQDTTTTGVQADEEEEAEEESEEEATGEETTGEESTGDDTTGEETTGEETTSEDAATDQTTGDTAADPIVLDVTIAAEAAEPTESAVSGGGDTVEEVIEFEQSIISEATRQ